MAPLILRALTNGPPGPASPSTRQQKKPADGGLALLILKEPAVGIEPTTARLRIECSTTELRWRSRAGANTPAHHLPSETACPGADSNRDALRHHPLKMACLPISPPGRELTICSLYSTEPTGLEPATSRVTVECSNQAELRLPANDRDSGSPRARFRAFARRSRTLRVRSAYLKSRTLRVRSLLLSVPSRHSPYGSRTRLCTVKGCRPSR